MSRLGVTVVTGASRGIGRAVALRLARPDATLVMTYRHRADLAEQTAAAVRAAGGRALIRQVEMRDQEAIEALFAEIEAACGRIDHLVNTVAAASFKPATRTRPFHLQHAHDINTCAFVTAAQQAARLMGRGGRIVALSSLGSMAALPRYGILGAQKAALESWVRHFAAELGPAGITVNAVTGGLVRTDSLAHYARLTGLDLDAVTAAIPQRRLGTGADIAEAVAFLLTPGAQYITGHTLVVDGGLSTVPPLPMAAATGPLLPERP